MKKVKFYGIIGNAYALIKSYLKDSYQRALIDDNLTQSFTSSEWGKTKHGLSQGSVLGPMIFLLYINYLPKVVNNNSKPVLFADDTSIIVSNPNLLDFKSDLISSYDQLNVWFNTNLLSLNYNKTQYIQFGTTNSPIIQLDISHNNKYVVNNINTRFLGIIVDSSFSRKNRTDALMVK
jgi:hypothetical protein